MTSSSFRSLRVYRVKFWLPLVIASTIILLTVYAAVQQDMRTGANDPQIQMAQDGAAVLEGGLVPTLLVGSTKIDMHASLAPFLIIYDDARKVVAASGYLNGEVPVLPSGVFDYAKNATDRITWQPASTTRVATIVKHFDGAHPGFIAAGRNLREVESREHQLTLMVVAAWFGLLVLTFIVILYSWAVERKAKEFEM